MSSPLQKKPIKQLTKFLTASLVLAMSTTIAIAISNAPVNTYEEVPEPTTAVTETPDDPIIMVPLSYTPYALITDAPILYDYDGLSLFIRFLPDAPDEPTVEELLQEYIGNMQVAVLTSDTALGEENAERYADLVYDNDLDNVVFSYEDLRYMAMIIYKEAGSNWVTDEQQCLTGVVLYNRKLSPEFPDTIKDCVYQRGQYSTVTSKFESVIPNEQSVSNAVKVLTEEFTAPRSVVFQANFRQGSGTYMSIYDEKLGTTSYYCYSNRPNLYS